MERILCCGKQTEEESAWFHIHKCNRYGCFVESNRAAGGEDGSYIIRKHIGIGHAHSFVEDLCKMRIMSCHVKVEA
eukprot:3696817-Ditylum_brightwellii.AAC.1